ncbi:helix-turn-helix domain-containing protein [Streptomyces sp. 796.1]|uniref:helix-turn-helix domain-containing protein n=1 Tax=Streptomyces sp. 796.1 TaxID=3163029 RepID=UPI0039C9731C
MIERPPETQPLSAAAYFGQEVRALRESLGLSQDRFAEEMHYQQSQISKVESGAVFASEAFARALDVVAKTPGVYRRLRERLSKLGHPDWFAPYVDLEAKATVVRMFNPLLLPGLVQTRAYAEEVLRAGRPLDLEALVTARLGRQAILTRQESPARLWLVINEAVLRAQVGSAETMQEQLLRVRELAETPLHRVQVVPAGRLNTVVASPFGILSFKEGPDVAHVDGFPRGYVLAERSDVDRASDAYDLVRALALPPGDTAELIDQILKGYNT